MMNRANFQDQKRSEHINRYWFVWFSVMYGVFVGLPFLAPWLMEIGAEIQYRWQQTVDPVLLRQYIGDPAAGWKVAWSDRMVALYTSILLFAWLWWPLRKKIRPLHLYGFVLLALPMVMDGASHMISDLACLNQGFRCTNTWLAMLTQNAFPGWFYYGDAFGSFNSWMRLITGSLFGLGVVWFLFPIMERHISAERLLLQARRGLRDQLLQMNRGHLSGSAQPDSHTS